MNPIHPTTTRTLMLLSMLLGSIALARAQTETLIECDGDGFSDSTSRGFYVSNYPGQTMSSVTLYMRTQSSNGTYQLTLDVTQDTFDGPAVASGFASASLNPTAQAIAFQMTDFVQGQQIGNPPVTPGATLCFKIGVSAQPGAPTVYYSVTGVIGEDENELSDPCRLVVQTNDAAAPLSSFRREGVRLKIVGERAVDTDEDCLPDAYEMKRFGGISLSDGTPDTDGDGDSDWQEWLAGTDPADRKSRLALELVRLPNGDYELCWNSIAGRIYTVEKSTDLESFAPLTLALRGIGDKDSVMVGPMGERGFFRLVVTNLEIFSKR